MFDDMSYIIGGGSSHSSMIHPDELDSVCIDQLTSGTFSSVFEIIICRVNVCTVTLIQQHNGNQNTSFLRRYLADLIHFFDCFS